MKTFASYDDMAVANAAPSLCPVCEGYSPVSIVGWYNTIRFKLRAMVSQQEKNRNSEYALLLTTYANTWEKYPIDANLNREVVELLMRTAEPYASMDWNQQTFFQGLVKSLSQLIADQQTLPANIDTDQNNPMAGGGGSSMPPLSPDFGPQENPPPGVDNAEGSQDGAPGVPGEEGKPVPLPGEEQAPGALPPGRKKAPLPQV